MFSQTARYYDKIYLAMKDYGAEAEKLTGFIREHQRSLGNECVHEEILPVEVTPW
jgi:hypothetical protein